MNHDSNHVRDDDGPLSDALRWQLRALRQDVDPPPRVWQGISARISEPGAGPRRRLTHGAWALAASVLLAVGSLAWLQRTQGPSAAAAPVALQEARALERQYLDAIGSIDSPRASAPVQSALVELDRSAREIGRALKRDPDSRLLLEQLRRTYDLRLALSQRASIG